MTAATASVSTPRSSALCPRTACRAWRSAIVDEGRVVYANGFGVATLAEPTRPVTRDTVFHLASVTKTFVATAVMQLVERRQLSLDAPIVTYLPYFRDRRRALQRDHDPPRPDAHIGFARRRELRLGFDRNTTTAHSSGTSRSLSTVTLRSAPGSTYAYSNLAFEVLGDVIAKASRMPFEDYVQKEILESLQMTSSTLLYDDVARHGLGRRPYAPRNWRDDRHPALSLHSRARAEFDAALDAPRT